MHTRHLRFQLSSALALTLTLALAAGCNEPIHHARKKTASAPAPPKEEDHFIVGKRTTEVANAESELKNGARVGSTRIVARDPITVVGNAYVSSIGRISIGQIDHAMDLYKTENERYPKDFEEFQSGILKPNNIALPQLPHYQKYGYDVKTHKLIILEYPDLKNPPPR